MYNLIPVLASIDPTKVEGLLSHFGLHPTVLAIILYAIAVINFLIPVVGPFVYRLFGKQIDQVKVALASFKDFVQKGFEETNSVIVRIDKSLEQLATQTDLAKQTHSEVGILTDLLVDVLKYSRAPDGVKEKVETIKASRAARDLEYSKKVAEQEATINNLRRDIAAIKDAQEKFIEKVQAHKKNKKR